MDSPNMDHLFRQQFGKMVSTLTRVFGLTHLELVEDAVQDTFIQAIKTWSLRPPENPEAWLMTAAKHRVLDILRSIKSSEARSKTYFKGADIVHLDDLFSDEEVRDSEMRMIFTACHPSLDPRDQIIFALKTISGFSIKEIASALLLKDETAKKRLARARKRIKTENLKFEIPSGKHLTTRLNRVLEVIYLVFNEGFHSSYKESIVRKDLCQEALRLNHLVLSNPGFRKAEAYALMALMSFHSARLDGKLNQKGEIVDFRDQDREKWDKNWIQLGDRLMQKAVDTAEEYSAYHYEAAIAAEHLKAKVFEDTDWHQIAFWYTQLYDLHPTATTALNLGIVYLQLNDLQEAEYWLSRMEAGSLGPRAYLYFATFGELLQKKGRSTEAADYFKQAVAKAGSPAERSYLAKKYGLS